MKQKTLLWALMISIAANIVLYKKNLRLNKTITVDQVQISQAAIKKDQFSQKEKELNLKGIKNSILEVNKSSHSELQETKINEKSYVNEDEIEKAREAWRNKASDFMRSELYLEEKRVDDFFQLSVDRDEELSQFMKTRILDNGGDQFFYTLEDIVNENKINEKYLTKLKNLFGEKGYLDYKKFRNAYNSEIISTGEGFFLIEL